MLELPDSWTWDFWLADTGTEYHLFFLFASRALGEESRRHRRASIGHAVSTDLVTWTRVSDALVRSDTPSADDVATWTGSIVQADDGEWHLFFTGCSDDPVPTAQRVMVATSTDLMHWRKSPAVIAAADPRWYATGADGPDEPFRDPWVFSSGGQWHMLITARAPSGEPTETGIIGHVTSPDLLQWEVQPPVTGAGHGFGQLEVPQVVEIDGRWLVLFSCLRAELAPWRRDTDAGGGVWMAEADGPLGPFHLENARRLTDESLYSGRVIQDRCGAWQFLAFENYRKGEFVGRLSDPVPFAELRVRTVPASAG
ncbi:MAG: glycosyl hydrolase family 32 [Microbacteriaceae bacterium]|nr:MAG: glycosyl hydrolase family 32 [Microbacteriaceae bacterium]